MYSNAARHECYATLCVVAFHLQRRELLQQHVTETGWYSLVWFGVLDRFLDGFGGCWKPRILDLVPRLPLGVEEIQRVQRFDCVVEIFRVIRGLPDTRGGIVDSPQGDHCEGHNSRPRSWRSS